MTVPSSFVDDIHSDGAVWVDGCLRRPDLPPGSAEWSRGLDGGIASLTFVCPCGCGSVGAVTVRAGYGDKCCLWNGDEVRPTLTPSILKTSPCAWHGFLIDGVFRSA